MTDDMVERVARAMYLEWITSQLDDEYIEWDRLPDKETWRIRARAAIEAMRDDRHSEIVSAYMQGALDVHEHYEPDIDPDFTEAAHDYAANLAALNQGQPK